MAQYYLQNDVLDIIKEYDDCDELLADLLQIKVYNDDGKPIETNITNINFICDDSKIEEILTNIAKNNNGQIIIMDGDKND